jgi:antitoxin MazE
MRVKSEIKRWGNSLALRLTGPMAEVPRLHEGRQVVVEVREDMLIIKPAAPAARRSALPYTEAQLLKGLDANTAHADELAILAPKEWADNA